MESFEFHNPTKIIFGKNCLNKAGEELKALGNKCLLVLGQKSAKESGIFYSVVEVLEKIDIKIHILEGIKSNPVLSKVHEGIEVAQKNGIDFVLALGGGSVMDTAKAIAAGVFIEEDVWLVFEGKKEIKKALPICCIPTLAASGSEMNGFMVITNEKTGYKLAAGSPKLYPRVSFLNPELTYTVPKDYTAYGGVDAICHLLEPYFNGPYPFTPVQDEIAEGLIRTLMSTTKACIMTPTDYDNRASFMWAATLALNGLTRAGVGDHPFPVHLIEHSLSAIYEVAHGKGLAALLPGWMRWKAQKKGEPKKVAQLGIKCFGLKKEGDELTLSEKTADNFGKWLNEINCPKSLSEMNIFSKDFEKIAENALFQATVWGITEDYNKETILEILSFCQ